MDIKLIVIKTTPLKKLTHVHKFCKVAIPMFM